MPPTYTKRDPYTLQVDVEEPVSRAYDYAFLVQQRATVQAARDAELAEIDALLAQARHLGLVERPVPEPAPPAAPRVPGTPGVPVPLTPEVI